MPTISTPSPPPPRDPRRRAKLTAPEILSAIRRWNDRYGEPPTMADWDPYRARQLGQEWRIARYDDGDWPSAKSVRNHFGQLSAAITAAGLVPRRQGQQRADVAARLDEQTLLHVAYIRAAQPEQATPTVLADAVREVSRARACADGEELRVALIQLAATALQWAATTEAGSA